MKIVGLGDSITDGFPYQKKDSWFDIVCDNIGVEYCNMGINGDRTEGMLYRIEEVLAVEPDLVTILGGTNDAFHHLPLTIVQKNIEEMVRKLRSATKVPIVILGIPIPLVEKDEESLLALYRDWMNEYANQEKIPVIDFYSALLDTRTGAMQREYDIDGCHPSKAGYAKMAEVANQVITEYVKTQKGNINSIDSTNFMGKI